MPHRGDDSDGIERLRHCIRDLTAISLLPAIWKDYGPQQIAQSLCETLRAMNDAAFVSISLDLRNGQPPFEILCTSNDIGGDQRGAIQAALSHVPQPLPTEAIIIPNPFGTGSLRIVKIAVGFAGAGSLIIGSSRLDFPTKAQRLVLGAAASELATGLHRWHAAANEWCFVSLADKSSDFISVAALDGVVQYVNPLGLELVGLGPLQGFGHLNVLDFFDAQNRERVRDELWPLVLREGRWVGEIGLRHFVTGAIVPLLHEWFVIDDMRSGQRLNVATVSRDLSARVRWETELRDLNTMLEHRVAERTGELAAANRRLVTEMAERERADAQRQVLQLELFHASRLSAGGQMAAAFAHELNQPLTAATTFLSMGKRLLAKETIDVQTIGETLDEAGGQMRRAGQIIRRLRDFITRGECEKRTESVVTIVEEARALALIRSVQRLGG